jgi:hypothetical protein
MVVKFSILDELSREQRRHGKRLEKKMQKVLDKTV